MKNFRILLLLISVFAFSPADAAEKQLKIEKQYLNIPVSHNVERRKMTFTADGQAEREFVIRLAPDRPEYWVFADVSALRGKTLTIRYEGDPAGLAKIYQSDTIQGQETIYREPNRPQVHFTTRRGWINDPNGLICYDGEYHLFYQLNPYERDWENMHWGHAVSRDLLHWKELAPALYPDRNGTAYSGSAVIDYDNTSGFGEPDNPAMVAVYTAALPDRQTQCIAYSLDRGRTWRKYEGNPVIDSKERWESVDTRDPKVFWHAPAGHWVMVLNERDGHSIYTSADLKNWRYESHTTGFWECPELFELPVDGDPDHTLWVMYGASGTYMLGRFDGREFTPLHGKYLFQTGTAYAGQTFTNIPASDGRRIQVAWGRLSHPGMPFNGMMLLPTELSLRTTKDGVRLFSTPVRELETLCRNERNFPAPDAATATTALNSLGNWDALRIRATLELFHATDGGLRLNGQELVRYDLNSNTVNGVFYSPREITNKEISVDIIVDRTSVEVFVDGGAYSYSFGRGPTESGGNRFEFFGDRLKVEGLSVCELESVWK